MRRKELSNVPASEWEYGRISETAKAFHFSINTVRKIATEAGAFVRVGRRCVLIDMRKFRGYLAKLNENHEEAEETESKAV